MAVIKWDQPNERYYETGTDQVVLYKVAKTGVNAGKYGVGVPWNGFTSLSESPSGAEETALYANNRKYLSLYSNEEFGGTLNAYTYPDEWEECDGSANLVEGTPGITVAQQSRTSFGLTYRTRIGNDTAGDSFGYKIHLVYGATASPSSKDYQTINDSPEAIEFSWEFKTVPVEIGGGLKPTSHLIINSTEVSDATLKAIEDILYGTENTDPRLPMPSELITLINASESGATGATGATGETGATGSTGESVSGN